MADSDIEKDRTVVVAIKYDTYGSSEQIKSAIERLVHRLSTINHSEIELVGYVFTGSNHPTELNAHDTLYDLLVAYGPATHHTLLDQLRWR